MSKPLTRRQAECLSIINRFTERHGYAPTLRELTTELGVVSLCSPFKLMEALRQKGYLKAVGHNRQARISSPELERHPEYRRGYEDGYFAGLEAGRPTGARRGARLKSEAILPLHKVKSRPDTNRIEDDHPLQIPRPGRGQIPSLRE